MQNHVVGEGGKDLRKEPRAVQPTLEFGVKCFILKFNSNCTTYSLISPWLFYYKNA